jgi:hypothetical protein
MLLTPPETTREFRKTPGTLTTALASVITHAGIDPALEGADLQEALHRAIAMHRCSCTWTKIHAGWVVAVQFPEPRRFFGMTLEEALAWCLTWIMEGGATIPSHDYESPRRSYSAASTSLLVD